MLSKTLAIVPLVAGAILALPVQASAGAITYMIDEPVGVGGIKGSITTDGATGVLSFSDLLKWSLTVSDGTKSFTLTDVNSGGEVVGSDLTATATELRFNFSATDSGVLFFQEGAIGNVAPYACFITARSGCYVGTAIVLDPLFGNNGNNNPYKYMIGDQVIGVAGNAVPEPATWAMLLVGLAGVGYAARSGAKAKAVRI